jgi:hypothetical protein
MIFCAEAELSSPSIRIQKQDKIIKSHAKGIPSIVQNNAFYLFNVLEMLISGYQRTPDFHTTAGYPDIVNRDLGALLSQR